MKKIQKISLAVLTLVFPVFVLAASPAYDNLQTLGQGGSNAPWDNQESGKNDVAGIIGIAIKAFISILGLMFLIYMLYAGWNWMTAQGDEEKVSKAKDTITRAIIGLIITIGAYAIAYFVIDRLVITTGILK